MVTMAILAYYFLFEVYVRFCYMQKTFTQFHHRSFSFIQYYFYGRPLSLMKYLIFFSIDSKICVLLIENQIAIKLLFNITIVFVE